MKLLPTYNRKGETVYWFDFKNTMWFYGVTYEAIVKRSTTDLFYSWIETGFVTRTQRENTTNI